VHGSKFSSRRKIFFIKEEFFFHQRENLLPSGREQKPGLPHGLLTVKGDGGRTVV
jgi:hypothetical protein